MAESVCGPDCGLPVRYFVSAEATLTREKRGTNQNKLRILSNEKFECFHRLTLTLPALLSEVEAG